MVRVNQNNAAKFQPDSDDIFARIAGRYDFLCDVFSLFIHRYWKSQTARYISEKPFDVFLDAATGTGHIALRVLNKMEKMNNNGRASKIIASDVCPQMLRIAQTKTALPTDVIEFQVMDAHDLKEVDSNSIDIVSVSLAMKICDRKKVLQACYRVLRPGGIFVCLEASTIQIKSLRWLYLNYMDWCLPIIGKLATRGDASAYLYLLKGIHEFPDQKTFQKELTETGFVNVGFKNFSFGIVSLHTGIKNG